MEKGQQQQQQKVADFNRVLMWVKNRLKFENGLLVEINKYLAYVIIIVSSLYRFVELTPEMCSFDQHREKAKESARERENERACKVFKKFVNFAN